MPPIILLILDGWGLTSAWAGNALNSDNTPNFHSLWRQYPHFSLNPYPLPVSNAAVFGGDLSYSIMGSGRALPDEGDQISAAFQSGKLVNYPKFVNLFNSSQPLHIVGFLDALGAHSRVDHLISLAKMAYRRKKPNIYFHLALEGRGDFRDRSYPILNQLFQGLRAWGGAQIVSLFGTGDLFDERKKIGWMKKFHGLVFRGQGWYFSHSHSALFEKYYQTGAPDRDFPFSALKVAGRPVGRIEPNDTVVVACLKPSTARPIVQALGNPRLLGLSPRPINLYNFIDFGLAGNHQTLFPIKKISATLSEILSQNGKRQLKITSNENSNRISYYFNGGEFASSPQEEKKLLVSPAPNRDPSLGIQHLFKTLFKALDKNAADFYVLSLPSAETISHYEMGIIGEFVWQLDWQIGRAAEEAAKKGAQLVITASSGNLEEILDRATGDRNFRSTRNLVPCLIVGAQLDGAPKNENILANAGIIPPIIEEYTLADIAPTILELFGIPKPTEMTGQSLLANSKIQISDDQ